jgi:endonuclease YncB( thermonuclease family)
MLRTACIFAFLSICSIAEAENISEVPRVVDGDTLVVGATKIRLEGIDAPETDQICVNARGDHWTCGIEARDSLQAHIEGQVVLCLSKGTDVYQRSLRLTEKN